MTPRLVAIHRHPESLQILGIWVAAGGGNEEPFPVSCYDGADPYPKILGRHTMAQKGIAPSWVEWFVQLSHRTPLMSWWEVELARPGETPPQILDRLRREQMARRR